MSRARFSLPNIAHVADILFDHWSSYHAEATNGDDDTDTSVDVRLWATSSERISHPMCWGVEFGSSDYDQIHGDICSSTSLDLAATPDRKTCEREAREMLADLRSQRAEYYE